MVHKYLVVPFVSVMIAQFIKFIIESVENRKLMWERLFNGNGGIPSSHVSFTFSLAVALFWGEGIDSPLFAIALILACVVSYDSMGVRLESGKQAVAINNIYAQNPSKGFKKLKEQLGHHQIEVAAGAVLAYIIATVIMLYC